MRYLLNKSMDNIASLRHFYDIQKKYIDKKAKLGMKENRMGYLTDFYFNVMKHGSEEEKEKSTFKNLQKAIEKHITIQEITDKSVIYTIQDENSKPFTNVSAAAKEYEKYAEMPITHGNNTLIMLITRFEEFISDFIEIVYLKFPQKYLDSQTITFSEIAQNDVEKIRQKIISREVEAIMRDKYSTWFKLFEEHKMSFKCCENEYETLKELYARRNILVHNSGEVNDCYLKAVPKSYFEEGERLYADEEYLNRAFESIKTLIFCILIEGVRLEKDNKDEYIDNIFKVAFNELVSENYNTCQTVFYSLYKSPFVDEMTRHMAQVNYWISKIEIEGVDSVKDEIEKLDVSALDKIFLLAKHILLNKYKEATVCVEELYEKKELPFYALEEWPLFKRYRESDEYNSFKENHPELTGVVALETKSENPMDNKETTKNIKTELNDGDITDN